MPLCRRTHLFKYLNGPLRKTDVYGPGKKPHPLPVTMLHLSEGIKRLRAAYMETEQTRMEAGANSAKRQVYLYRGMKQVDVGDDFMRGCQGGTEIAPMSTTTDLQVAVHYGLGPESLLFVLAVDNMLLGERVRLLIPCKATAGVDRPGLQGQLYDPPTAVKCE